MGLNCGAKVAKFLLILFDIIFWLSGIALIIVGAIYASKTELLNIQKFILLNDPLFTNVAYVMIGVGCFIFVVSFCGLFGAIKENRCLLITYTVFLIIVMGAELGFGIYVAVKKTDLETQMTTALKKFIKNDFPSQDDPTNAGKNNKMVVDYVQHEMFQCCGIEGPGDWIDTTWYRNLSSNEQVWQKTPPSCCNDAVSQTYPNADNGVKQAYKTCQASSTYFADGCIKKGEEWVKTYFPILIGIGCGIAGLQIIGMICAICLCVALRDKDEKYA